VALVRLDRDTTTRKHSFSDAITTLMRGESSLIVGTQMLAKGHHLPAVTLAVIAGVDEGLMSADFRASERLAQLIIQVAGRSGRAHRPGEVLLQTHLPEHPLLQRLLMRGYGEFARAELAERAPARLPPITYALVVRAEHEQPDKAEHFLAAVLAAAAEPVEPGLDLAGPMAAPQPRRQGRSRFQLIAIADERGALHRFAERASTAAYRLAKDRALRWHLDVDPLDFG
jgi:primosomal protein N' (replication factor Y)